MASLKKVIWKTITWRLTAIISSGIIIYAITFDVMVAGVITIAINVLHTILYYVHERIWNKYKLR